jgi:hypothetical protein
LETAVGVIVLVLLLAIVFATVGVRKPETVQHQAFNQLSMPRKLLVPNDENEMIMIRSLLESEGIPYHVRNDQFGTLYPGPGNFGLNERAIFVDESDYDTATVLIREGKQEE